MALKSPFFTQLSHKEAARAAGLAVETVVSPHNGLDLGIADQSFESREISLFHIFRRSFGVKAVPQFLRPAVDGKVFGAGRRFQGLALSLQAPYEGCAQSGRQIRILAVGLLSPAPAWVAKDIHIGRPHGQPVVDIPIALSGKGVVFGPRFGGDDGSDGFQQLIVEHGRHTDGLGKAGGRTAPGQTVQSLVPPVISGNVKACDGRGVETQLIGHLCDSHAAHQFFGQFFCLLALHGCPGSFLILKDP